MRSTTRAQTGTRAEHQRFHTGVTGKHRSLLSGAAVWDCLQSGSGAPLQPLCAVCDAITPYRREADQVFCSLRRISCSSSSFFSSSIASVFCSRHARCHSVYLLITRAMTEVIEVIVEMISAV